MPACVLSISRSRSNGERDQHAHRNFPCGARQIDAAWRKAVSALATTAPFE
jgi:hypothetical protein